MLKKYYKDIVNFYNMKNITVIEYYFLNQSERILLI